MSCNDFSAKNGHGPRSKAPNGKASNGHSAPLGHAPRGFRGRIDAIEVSDYSGGLSHAEIESRLIELGFVEGAHVEILHEGAFSRDPIAVRVNHATIALRRREAMAIFVS